MSAEGGRKAIIAAMLANLGHRDHQVHRLGCSPDPPRCSPRRVHSVADTGNQVLLLRGGRRRRSARPTRSIRSATAGSGTSTRSSSPIILFSVGGVFSIYEGVDKLTHPHALEVRVAADRWCWSIAMVLESFSLRTAPCGNPTGCAATTAGSSSSATPRRRSCRSCCWRTSRRWCGLRVRLPRRRSDDHHRQQRVRRDRHPRDRRAAGAGGHRARHRDEEPAGRRGREPRGCRRHPHRDQRRTTRSRRSST